MVDGTRVGVDRCTCCDLPVESCGKAAETRITAQIKADEVKLHAWLLTHGWFLSLYPGFCQVCHERFPANIPIKRMGEQWTKPAYVAACCADVQLAVT